MNLYDNLERRFGHLAIANLTLVVIAGQAICFLVTGGRPMQWADLYLVPQAVLAGEVWRLLSFLIVPTANGAFGLLIALYFYYFVGTTVEAEWGAFRYNLYVFASWLAVVVCAFIVFGVLWALGERALVQSGNWVILTSVFLAFARLNPNFEILFCFILPIKARYLGYVAWASLALTVLSAPVPDKVLAIAAVSNYFIFFGRQYLHDVRAGHRRRTFETKISTVVSQHLHVCAVCGLTEADDATAEFRVCSSCRSGEEYCEKHIRNHQHS